jgi:hypothetical protein
VRDLFRGEKNGKEIGMKWCIAAIDAEGIKLCIIQKKILVFE